MENTKAIAGTDEVDNDGMRIETLNDSVYEVRSEDDIILYASGILDIRDTVFSKGIEFLREDRSFVILYDILAKLFRYVRSRNLPGFTFMLEENYVDRVYRDSYYIYFSGKHFWYSRFCKRIFLFANIFETPLLKLDAGQLKECFAGTVVITPVPGQSIGRTLINPKYFIGNTSCYIRTANYGMTAYGKRVQTKAFPYSMQDCETTTCAEITILNLMDYYSQSYPEYRYLLPGEINKLARENGYERTLPTHGLQYEMISKVFYESGFYPRMYSTDKMPKDKFRRILYYYIESGIPLSLGVATARQNKHSIVVIGHGGLNLDSPNFRENVYDCYDKKSGNLIWIHDAADIARRFCIMDDNQAPYALLNCDINKDEQLFLGDYVVETMMVPLYKKMYLEASDASEIFKVLIASKEYGIKDADIAFLNQSEENGKDSLIDMKKNPLTIRIFMTSSRSLRKVRDSQFADQNEEVKIWYSTTVFPRFVWVCELSLIESHTKNVIGELVLDATSSADAYADSLIIAHYPGRIFCRLPADIQTDSEDDEMDEFHRIRNWHTFLPYDSNLSPVVGYGED